MADRVSGVAVMKQSHTIIIPRELLLVEIARRCRVEACKTRVFFGLTRPEALRYRGFECEQCRAWNDDRLTKQDVDDWWVMLEQQDI